MEFLRDESIDEAEPTTEETSKDIAIVDSGEEKGPNPVDSSVELDKPEAWSDQHQGGTKKGIIGNWLEVIGRLRISERGYLNSDFFQRRRCCPVLCFFLV